MRLSLWITITIYYMFYQVISSTGTGQASDVLNPYESYEVITGIPEQTTYINNTLSQLNLASSVYIIIYVPITVVLLVAVTITVLVIIYKRKRQGDLLQQESVYYGNSVSSTVEHSGYKPTEKENDDYEPESDLTPKEDPIYVNVQGECSSEPSVEGDQTENIYCNVDYERQH